MTRTPPLLPCPPRRQRSLRTPPVLEIPDGELLEGDLPKRQMKLVQAWIELHQDDLMADWYLASTGQTPFKIDPLR